MVAVYIIVGSYLAVGLLFLIIFELATKRLRHNLPGAADEAQVRIANTANTFNAIAGPAGQMPTGLMGKRVAAMAILLTSWLFWPAVLISFLRSRREGDTDEK